MNVLRFPFPSVMWCQNPELFYEKNTSGWLIFKQAVCCEEQKNNGAHWVWVWRKVMWLMILCRTFRRQVNIPLLFPSLGVVTSGFPRQLSAKDREMRWTLVSQSLRTKGSHKKCLHSTLTAFHSVSQGMERAEQSVQSVISPNVDRFLGRLTEVKVSTTLWSRIKSLMIKGSTYFLWLENTELSEKKGSTATF